MCNVIPRGWNQLFFTVFFGSVLCFRLSCLINWSQKGSAVFFWFILPIGHFENLKSHTHGCTVTCFFFLWLSLLCAIKDTQQVWEQISEWSSCVAMFSNISTQQDFNGLVFPSILVFFVFLDLWWLDLDRNLGLPICHTYTKWRTRVSCESISEIHMVPKYVHKKVSGTCCLFKHQFNINICKCGRIIVYICEMFFVKIF